MERQKCNLSCFPVERKHKEAKGIATFMLKNCAESTLPRLVYNYFAKIQSEDVFQEFALGRLLVVPEWAKAALRQLASCRAIVVSEEAKTPRGRLRIGDVAFCSRKAVLCKLGLFAKTESESLGERFWAIVLPLAVDSTAERCWFEEPLGPEVVALSLVSASLIHCSLRGRIFA